MKPSGTVLATFTAAAALAAGVALSPALAQEPRAQTGMLECDISGGVGFIIGSRKEVQCEFLPAEGGRPEYYVGAISKFGLDLGVTTGGRMVWAVFADTVSPRRAALEGTYGGASAEATIAVGLGANVLVGGSETTYALQPLSFQGQTGLNVAAGVTELRLERARRGRGR